VKGNRRPIRASGVAAVGAATITAMCSLGAIAVSRATAGASSEVALAQSVPATSDQMTGNYASQSMTVQVALQARDASGLAGSLQAMYTPGNTNYHHWLAAGQFDAQYAPPAAERGAVAGLLRHAGLTVQTSVSPFLVQATGSSKQVSAVFHTTLRSYRDKHGITYYQNSSPVLLPASMAAYVQGVTGLTNTIRDRSGAQRVNEVAHPAGSGSSRNTSCETPYPDAAEMFTYANTLELPYGYGGGPGCSGLTPSQTNSIYGAPDAGSPGKGQGVTIAVFELSAYRPSDINTWARSFYGPSYKAPLVDVNILGGPLNPRCPAGDTCPPGSNGYAGDIEVDADIETQLALAPDVKNLIVYNAPNDVTGQTELAEYAAIANADRAESISSSWSACENDVTVGEVQAENTIFEQMAMQGQSMFGAEGDTGAFSCLRSDGTRIVNVLDPASQPWVTSVGGTSFETDNPGHTQQPTYPAGVESVWNVDSLCNTAPASPATGNYPGYFWCEFAGAGGGGSSQWWGRPSYQRGPGVNNPSTTTSNGTTHCALAQSRTPCREDPDISANADEFTPYAEYCTGNARTPYSVCASISSTAPGWFGIGGTSLSAPLWSGIIADRDSFHGNRSGNINPLLYLLFNKAPQVYFHDITGQGQTTINNGLFSVTPGYDEATGIGTPKMAALITRSNFGK
jgi:subtilase family serine protease